MTKRDETKMAETERDLEITVRSAGRRIREALDRAEGVQRAADTAWNEVNGARHACAKAQLALARHRFGVGIYGPGGKKTFKKAKA